MVVLIKHFIELFPISAGALLFFAGASKAVDFSHDQGLVFNSLLLVGELALGCTLVLGFVERFAVVIALISFFSFAAYHVFLISRLASASEKLS